MTGNSRIGNYTDGREVLVWASGSTEGMHAMGSNTIVVNDFTVLTSLPAKEPAESLVSFLADNEIYAFTIESDAKADAGPTIDVRVPVGDEERARALLEQFNAKADG